MIELRVELATDDMTNTAAFFMAKAPQMPEFQEVINSFCIVCQLYSIMNFHGSTQ